MRLQLFELPYNKQADARCTTIGSYKLTLLMGMMNMEIFGMEELLSERSCTCMRIS